MIKYFYTICIATLLIANQASAADKGGMYLGLFYGKATSASDTSLVDAVDGKVMGLTLGTKLSPTFGLELMVRKTNFDAVSESGTLLGKDFSYEAEVESLVVGPGFRWFIVTFLNIHAGLGYASAKANATAEVDGVSATGAIADDSGLGIYYGAGLQFPLGMVDITADYTINKFASDISSNEITGGLRFNF